MPDKIVSVVVPVYYNADSLPLLHERLTAVEKTLMDLHGVRLQLIFVNDGSRDGSQLALVRIKEQRPDAVVVRLSRNFGAVHASRTGFRFVEGGAFVILAADLQDPPELLLEMVPRWLAGRKFVIAVRASREDPLSSRIYSWVYYRVLRLLVLPGYPDGGFDIALMDRDLLEPMRNCSKNAFTPLLAYWLGYEPEVVSYHRPRREHGRSGWTFTKKIKTFLDVMLGFSVTPIRLISAVGVFVAGASFVYGISVVIAALSGNIPVLGYASLVSLVTFLLGLIILMLGIIGEYLWRIFDEVNRRPDTVIDEVL
ncbi:MAG: glycosyltransferase family 2 protein [Pseudomonadota bacterium]|nr:glycosyltransferase family 2 protein [Pseudomonadota bacterium]